jgi:hypothetical protein
MIYKMEKDIQKILKQLKQIQPDPNYSKRSRLFILNSNREEDIAEIMLRGSSLKQGWFSYAIKSFHSVKLAFAVGSVIIVLALAGSTYYINKELNRKNLVVRASETNTSIQVKLNEIKYLLENKQKIDPALVVTIQALLEEAANDLKEVSSLSSEGKNLSESLEKMKSVQEIFYQIDTMLEE